MMNINSIYIDSNLKYALTDQEYKAIDEVWDFITIFNHPFIYVTDLRNYLIDTISNKYTVQEFMWFETIAEKMFWNLRWKLFPLFASNDVNDVNDINNVNTIPMDLLQYKIIPFSDDDDMKYKIDCIKKMETFYRSFINKVIMVDYENNIIYNKRQEGSADIFSNANNSFNLYTLTILLDRQLYEKVIMNPNDFWNMHIPTSEYYYQYDYGFPNLNCCAINIGNNDFRMKRINNMYFNGDARYWYKVLF